jgi:hypothetical protein
MIKKNVWLAVLALLVVALFAIASSQQTGKTVTQKAKNLESKVNSSTPSMQKTGKYLVSISGCNDCHSPKISMMPYPQPDSARMLSGHPANVNVPDVPAGVVGMSPNNWAALASSDFTAWAGPWGTSFTFNLTPDNATGIGAWTPDVFIKAMRTGKHMGAGRDILPPMPWYELRKATDNDLRAIFSYLKSLPAVSNQVPQPVMASEAGSKP